MNSEDPKKATISPSIFGAGDTNSSEEIEVARASSAPRELTDTIFKSAEKLLEANHEHERVYQAKCEKIWRLGNERGKFQSSLLLKQAMKLREFLRRQISSSLIEYLLALHPRRRRLHSQLQRQGLKNEHR